MNKAIDGEILPWKNLSAFSERVFKLRESQLINSKNTLTFFDRGIVDIDIHESRQLRNSKSFKRVNL